MSSHITLRRDDHATARHEACNVAIRSVAIVSVVKGNSLRFEDHFEVYFSRFDCLNALFLVRFFDMRAFGG